MSPWEARISELQEVLDASVVRRTVWSFSLFG